MASLRLCVVVSFLACVVVAQLPFSVVPSISDELRTKAIGARVTRFLRLWEFALKVDGQGPGPAIRVNFEPKTVLAPGPSAFFNLIPQDASDPLYGRTKALQELRRTFILDHLILDPIKSTDPKLEDGDGVRALTFTGKDIYFKKDKEGKIRVGGVPVADVTSLEDGTQVYVLESLLFDNKEKVRKAFNQRHAIDEELSKPLGPPLDIPTPSEFPSILRGSFAPSRGVVAPPAPPTFSGDALVQPPAPPPSAFRAGPPGPPNFDLDALPPALPTFVVDPEVLPPAPPPSGVAGPPAPPTFRAQFSAPGAPIPDASGDAIIFPSESERKRRQLSFPAPEANFDLETSACCDSGDLALPGVNFDLYSAPGGSVGREESSVLLEDNRPLDELTSIEQFATLFELSGSGGDSVVGVLQEEGLTTFLALLETTGLLNALVSGENGPYIVLAPSQSAFLRLSRDDLRQLARSTDLSYHLLPLRGQSPSQVTDDSTFLALDGSQVKFNVYDGKVFVNGVAVLKQNIRFPHGSIYVISSVLTPPLGDLQRVLVSSGTSVSRVNTLITVTDLLDAGSYTLLAPPDSAITSKGYTWPRLLMDRAKGRDLIRRHTISGPLYTDGLLQRRTVTTLAGTAVTFRKDVDGTISANGVPLLKANMTATNGIVHMLADVIPESDLGSDPTSVPHPLLNDSEGSIFASFGFGDDLVPSVPEISGLYDLPDHDPFRDFVRETSTESPSFISVSPDSRPLPLGRETGLGGVPPTTNTIQTGTNPFSEVSDAELSTLLASFDQTLEAGDLSPSLGIDPFPQTTTESSEFDPDFVIILDPPAEQGGLGGIAPTFQQPDVPTFINFPGVGDGGLSELPPSAIIVVPEGNTGCSPTEVTAQNRSPLKVLTLLERLNLTRFLDLLKHAGLAVTLSLDGPWTIFAPTDEAIDAIPSEALQEMSDNPAFLRRLLSYHLVPGRFTSTSSFTPGRQLPTLHAGYTLVLSYYTDGPVAKWVAGGSILTNLDEEGSNGAVHVIDRLLYAPYGNVFSTSRLSPVLTTFTNIVAEDEVLYLLFTESGPLTVFMPSDNALQNFSLPQDIQERRGWVLSHVVTGTWYTAGFSDTWPLITVNNDTLETTTKSGDRDEITVNGIQISYADITASNGVIHVIDSILFPAA